MNEYIETRMIEKVIVSLTPAEKELIKTAAENAGISMSRYLAEAAKGRAIATMTIVKHDNRYKKAREAQS